MNMGAASERGRIWRLMAHHVWQQVLKWVHGGPLFRLRPSSGVPARLLIAPQDLRTADATNAADIYGGRFLFAGQLVETRGLSPFELQGQHPDWQRDLHAFGWLRDLRAAESRISNQNARALVDDWINHCGSWHAIGWETPIVTRRVMAWLAHSPFVLEEGDHDFYRRFMKSLSRQVRYLRRTVNETPDGVERLRTALAIASACISMAGQGRFARQSIRRLDQELSRQILSDGGHISRNPRAIIDILADLLPVRQAFIAQGLELPAGMLQSVDRMMPMLRFFRHADGNLAHFNGMGSTPTDLLATILAYDDARGAAPVNVPYTGYQRLTGGNTVVVVDTGKPPDLMVSEDAHAGCLSFEMSSNLHRIVVNCGVSSRSNDVWRQVSRSTAAHSTATIDDTSSCRFLSEKPFGAWLGSPILSGPVNVPVTREDDDMGTRVIATHDGYASQFGVLHERDLRLAKDGSVLDGVDTFLPKGKLSPSHYFAIRFHLHPSLKCSLLRGGSAVLLVCKDGEAWEFDAPGVEVGLEESIYLSDVYGHRRTSQIVLSGSIQELPSLAWQFRRTAVARLSRRGTTDFDEELLPLED
ncbi:putative heparinase superfamily protein [Roseibium hamelinense]|uniref:Putative heparinase superfamily protein n=1 Tax=Roseibium hamelinense TaxID=150831 RepID=A0A562SP98_9HYPH|nr:heparinase II/III family protein [Roseibium hamelinense]MTI44058.1 heparinase [Roseibium hamelinense]TWI82734.1 putative heparinase superfamily protein [Roseibium hamelinense]